MLKCWNDQPKKRPTFKELRAKFDAMLLAEKKSKYIALCIDESQSDYANTQQSLTLPTTANILVTADKSFLSTSKKFTYTTQSSISLDKAHSIMGMLGHCDSHSRRPDRLSLQTFTDDRQGEVQDRYVPSPALSLTIQDSKMGFETEGVDQKY